MQKWHKIILMIVFIISLVTLIFSFGNYKDFAYDISMTLFTSILLFYFIDYVLEKHNQKEERKKLNIVISKIKPSLEAFYNFYVALYAGTIEKPITEDSPVLKNIFYNKDKLYESIVENLEMEKDSSYLDITRFSPIDSFSGKNPVYITWQKAFLNRYNSLFEDLTYLQMHYSIFLSSDLLYKLEELIQKLREPLNIYKNMEKFQFNKLGLKYENNETFYASINLKEIMSLFEEFIKIIQEESKINFMDVDIKNINNRNEHPLLGELLK